MTTTLDRPLLQVIGPRKQATAHGTTDRRPTQLQSKLLEKPIEYFVGLPYDTWEEVPLPIRPSEWRVLSVAEEQLLFQQMNLALYRAEFMRAEVASGEDRDELLEEVPDRQVCCEEIERLLRRAQQIRNELITA
jgi:hypothetical protein